MVDAVIAEDGRVCTKCGEFRSNDSFIAKRTGRITPRCDFCRKDARNKQFIAWRLKHPKLPQREAILKDGEKRLCRTCGERKDEFQFGRDKRSPDGLAWRCKECANKAHRHWTELNRDHVRDAGRVTMRNLRKRDPEKFRQQLRESRFRKKYGLSCEEVDAMFADANGICRICEREMKKGVGNHIAPGEVACVDHDHDTGAIRGMICSMCNNGLGLFRDNPQILESAAKYLRDFGK